MCVLLYISNNYVISRREKSKPSKHSSWWRCLEDVFGLRLQKTSSRRLDQDEYIRLTHTSSEDVFKTSSSRSTYSSWSYVFQTSSRRPQDIFKTSSRCFENVFKTSSRHLQDVFKTYYQVKVFLVTQFQDVFETYSKRFWDVLLRRLSTGGLPRSHFWKIYGQCTKFPRVIKISQVLIFHFTTHFSGYTLQRQLNIYNGVFFAKIPRGVELLTFLQKKLHPRCLTMLKIDFWLRVLHNELTFVLNLQIKPKKYSARKNVGRRFWKGERSW